MKKIVAVLLCLGALSSLFAGAPLGSESFDSSQPSAAAAQAILPHSASANESPSTLSCPASFAAAVAHYNAGEWDSARLGWERCLELGVSDFRVLYNLGNTWFRLGDLGRAIHRYEQALLIEPGNADALANLKHLQSLRVDKQPEQDVDPLFASLWKVHASLSPERAARLLWLGAALIGLLGTAVLLSRNRLRTVSIVALVLAVVALFPVALSAGYKAWSVEFSPRAVVVGEVVDLRSGPGHRDQVIATLHAGTVVEPKLRSGEWISVRVVEGVEGYLLKHEIEQINSNF